MRLLNPTRFSRYCYGLRANVEAYNDVEVADSFEACEHCSCVVLGDDGTVAATGGDEGKPAKGAKAAE